jgi:hypothetical protein
VVGLRGARRIEHPRLKGSLMRKQSLLLCVLVSGSAVAQTSTSSSSPVTCTNDSTAVNGVNCSTVVTVTGNPGPSPLPMTIGTFEGERSVDQPRSDAEVGREMEAAQDRADANKKKQEEAEKKKKCGSCWQQAEDACEEDSTRGLQGCMRVMESRGNRMCLAGRRSSPDLCAVLV